MEIRIYPFGPLQANLYVIVFGTDAFIVDPCVPLESLELDGLKVRGIFCTHAHYDHIVEAENIRNATGSILLAYEAECPAILDSRKNISSHSFAPVTVLPPICALKDGDILTPADFAMKGTDNFTITVLHTPGHTGGSMCLLFEEKTDEGVNRCLFSGDTIFAGTVGRTDLGGSMPDMLRSVQRISNLPDDVRIFPGHGPATAVLAEKSGNPYFTALKYNDII